MHNRKVYNQDVMHRGCNELLRLWFSRWVVSSWLFINLLFTDSYSMNDLLSSIFLKLLESDEKQ